MRSILSSTGLCALLLSLQSAAAVTLTEIKEVRFDGAQADKFSANTVLFSNLRVRSKQTTLNGYVEGTYRINHTTGGLTLENADVFPNVGVFLLDETFLAKDVPADIKVYRVPSNPNQYEMDSLYALSSANGPYYMNLTAGQSLSFHFARDTDAINFVFTSPKGELRLDTPIGPVARFADIVVGGIPILESGVHRIDFVPKSGASAAVSFRVLNENRRKLVNGVAGTRFAGTLRTMSRDYAKVKVTLKKGQTAVFKPNSSLANVDMTFCDSWGARDFTTVGVTGEGVEFTAQKDDDFYFFVSPLNTLQNYDTSFDFTLQIRNGLGFARWAGIDGVSSLLSGPNQDADRDGYPNLLEYALGSSASKPEETPVTPFARVGNQLRMQYTVPSYVEGVTISPEASAATASGWAAVNPSAPAAVPGGTRYEAMSSGTGARKFLRVKVTQN